MKIILFTLMLISSSSLLAQSSGPVGVTLSVRLHSFLAVDDVVVECVQKGSKGLVTFSLKTASTELLDVHLTIPEKIRDEEYYVEKMRLMPGDSYRLPHYKRGVIKHSAQISVLHAEFNLCENLEGFSLTATPL